jgi:hypothetical protein
MYQEGPLLKKVFVHQIIKTWPDFHSVFDDTITKGIKAVGLYKKEEEEGSFPF